MKTTKIKTSGMRCPSCAMLIEMNVSDLLGVDSVKAEHGGGMTTVSFDPSQIDEARIAQEIRNAGYEAEILA